LNFLIVDLYAPPPQMLPVHGKSCRGLSVPAPTAFRRFYQLNDFFPFLEPKSLKKADLWANNQKQGMANKKKAHKHRVCGH